MRRLHDTPDHFDPRFAILVAAVGSLLLLFMLTSARKRRRSRPRTSLAPLPTPEKEEPATSPPQAPSKGVPEHALPPECVVSDENRSPNIPKIRAKRTIIKF